MGLLRVYLSLCVVAEHSDKVFSWYVHSGGQAVQIFFVISGFYMALISTKYASRAEFYASRFLRIFIPYWVVFGIVLIASASTGLLFGEWLALKPYISYTSAQNGFLGVFFTALTNITLFFQDWVLFFKHDSGEAFAFTYNFWESKNALWHYLIVPQAWSIGVELTFYSLVPFLTRLSNKWVLTLISISLVLRGVAYVVLGLRGDPWSDRFFPFEIALFLFGILGFRVYMSMKNRFRLHRFVITNIKQYAIFSAGLVIFFYLAAIGSGFCGKLIGKDCANLFSYMVWAGVIPFLFCLSHKSSLDRYIGDLSFPIYLVHWFVASIARIIIDAIGISGPWLGRICALGSIVAAVALMKFIITPFENRRQSLAKSIADFITKIIPHKQPVSSRPIEDYP
jgi:peptidoglycan/LPS O-acetylase OafA/YrhL